ncbi:MAG: BamA/TamA family outer membrane protein [Chitinophagales bacterium]
MLPILKSVMRAFISLLFFVAMLCQSHTTFAQGFYTTFGQNRVQYHDFEWSYYESPNFLAYFYQGGQQLGKFAVMVAETNLDAIEAKLEFKVNRKVEIMVYHNLSDLKQSNIGQGIETTNTGGVTKIIGNKMFVSFDGDHNRLAEQIKEGIARIFLENMIYGGNIQEVLQNAVLLNLPDWFVNGMVSYVGEEWSTEMDAKLREFVEKDKLKNFNRLTTDEATFAGHALWHYIAQMNGESSIPNLLYLTRINRSLESGFLFVLGNTVKNTIAEFNEYYANLYASEDSNRAIFDENNQLIRTKKKVKRRNILYDEVKVSPSGRYIAYTTDEKGRHKVYLYDTQNNTQKLILKNGFRSFKQPLETRYPLLAWNKRSEKLAIVFEKRDQVKLMEYNVLEDEEIYADDMNKFQQISDIAYMDDSEKLILSAVSLSQGQSDLYTYFIPNTKTDRLTNDYFADLEPRFVTINGVRGIVFKSNRYVDTLKVEKLDSIAPSSNFDLFFYDLAKGEDQVLTRITNTPLSQEWLPMQYDSTHIAYLSDKNGIKNLYAAHFDSIFVRTDTKVFYLDSMVINPTYALDEYQAEGLIDTIINEDIYRIVAVSYPITNYQRNIGEYDIASKTKEIVQLHYQDGAYEVHKSQLPEDPEQAKKTLSKTIYRQQLENAMSSRLSANKNSKLSKSSKRDKRNSTQPSVSPTPSTQPNKKSNEKDNGDSDSFFQNPFEEKKPQGSLTDTILGEETEGADVEDIEPLLPNSDMTLENIEVQQQAEEAEEIDLENFFFQSEFDYDETITAPPASIELPSKTGIAKSTITDSGMIVPTINLPGLNPPAQESVLTNSRIRTYKTKFSVDNVVTQLDNTVIFNQYENFQFGSPTSGIPAFTSPDLNTLIKVGITDLMEDYRLIGGFRLPVGFGGSEYFVEYWNLKHRLDKKFLYYRRANNQPFSLDSDLLPPGTSYQADAKVVSNYFQTSFSYPLDVNQSVRLHVGARYDKVTYLASDLISLIEPQQSESWLFTKAEYVFDNTIDVALNIMNGTRFKVYAEVHKPFEAQFDKDINKLNFKDTGYLGIIGADFRHYQRVHKQIVWANRFASAYSYGTRKMLYYLGGVDNWLLFDNDKRFDTTTPIDQEQNYGFQSLATNVRGFKQNSRNGNSYAVLNSELRIPIFAYISNAPIRSEFFRNFQIVGFADVGVAWDGVSPFDDENKFTSVEVGNPLQTPVTATVRYFRNPVIGGYGVGVRSKLLGYFVRADWAWGVDNGNVQDSKWHIGLGLDF